jgi:hypothetical protein
VTYSTRLHLCLTTLLSAKLPASPDDPAAPAPLEQHIQPAVQQILALAGQLLDSPVTPQATLRFEQQLQSQLRQLGRLVAQHTYNRAEPHDVRCLPAHLRCTGGYYTRTGRKTPQNAWTLFGQVRLWRACYRSTAKDGEPAIFPLAQALGLIQGASPALASRAAALAAEAGSTQGLTRQRLRRDHAVGWGVKKLRQFLQDMAGRMAAQRHESQLGLLLGLLEQARASRGKHKPVLSVGRDGISLALRRKGGRVFEVASCATVSVLDRRGVRLGTAYLAQAPQAEQVKLSESLTRLLREVLLRWQGPLPRLCYVSDAGQSETGYYKRALSRMRHPRTGERLRWVRVVDYYHASQRVWAMAECLFGGGQRGHSWARKMQRWLLLPGGVNRVLHSAAAHQARVGLEGKKRRDYEEAYRYLQRRMRYLRYAEYRKAGLPLGSGVTEAACKTIYTQRLKLSGMRWTKPGAQAVLDLRVLLLSGVWEQAFQRVLEAFKEAIVPTHEEAPSPSPPTAA